MEFVWAGIVSFFTVSFIGIFLSVWVAKRASARNRYGFPTAMKIQGKINRIKQHNYKQNGERAYYEGE